MNKYVPANVEWFIAVEIEEFQVESETENLVYLNHILVKATSAEMAYQKAIKLCEQSNQKYQNSDGKTVTCRFRGLYDLFPIHDALEDGAELSFANLDSLSESEIQKLVRSKDELDLFRPSDTQEVQQ